MTEPLLSELLGCEPGEPAPDPYAVRRSDDFERVRALPRRAPWNECVTAHARSWTKALRTPHGTMDLRPVQSAALWEARHARGLFAPIGVGQGKTLVGLLLGTVLGAARPLVLVPPALVAQYKADRARYGEHFRIPDALQIMSYGLLSHPNAVYRLNLIEPDLIVCDEAHYLRHVSSARTKRFLRYLDAFPETRVCCLSGSMTKRSLRDYAHLATYALREGAPVPLRPRTVDEWSRALDADVAYPERLGPGVLAEFGEPVREGFARRVRETPGVVATTDPALETGLEIRALDTAELDARASDTVLEAQEFQGQTLDPLECARVARQLALGFWYEWAWPNDEPDTEWLRARSEWARVVNRALSENWFPDADSPLLVWRAIQARPEHGAFSVLERWTQLKLRSAPQIRVRGDFDPLRSFVAQWLRSSAEPGIVWYSDRAVGAALGPLAVLCGPERDPSTDVVGSPHIVASIKAHGTGKNLQRWSRALVLTPPSAGDVWEQLLGRQHRPGQAADTVTFDVLAHCEAFRGALHTARRDAAYISSTTGQAQKLELATWA